MTKQQATAKLNKLLEAGVSMSEEEQIDFLNSQLEIPVEVKVPKNSIEGKLEDMSDKEAEEFLTSLGLVVSRKKHGAGVENAQNIKFDQNKGQLPYKYNSPYYTQKNIDDVERLIEENSTKP